MRDACVGGEGMMHLELEQWHLEARKKTETGEDAARKSEEIEREDKIICLWAKTDLYLFEGDKHAQIQDIRHDQTQISNYSWKKMRLST
jgi:hypothetical protein